MYILNCRNTVYEPFINVHMFVTDVITTSIPGEHNAGSDTDTIVIRKMLINAEYVNTRCRLSMHKKRSHAKG